MRRHRAFLRSAVLATAITAFAATAVCAGTALEINARAWLLIDYNSQRALVEKDADKRLAPASLTKLMTAYLIFDAVKSGRLHLSDKIKTSVAAWNMPGSRMFLRSGDEVVAEQLLLGMLVRSANDATLALAEHIAGSEATFVAAMNERARTLGMNDTAFQNSTGLDREGHFSTARDLTKLAVALIRDFPEYYRLFSVKEFDSAGLTQYNRNALLWRDASVDGIKTGRTSNGGYCLIASAKRDDMRLIATIMGAKDEGARVQSGQRLIDYGFDTFETRLLYAAGTPAAKVRIWMGDSSVLPLGVERNLYVTLPRGDHDKLMARLTVTDIPVAPVEAGQVVGLLELTLEERTHTRYPLVALKHVGRGNILQRTIDQIELWFESSHTATSLE